MVMVGDRGRGEWGVGGNCRSGVAMGGGVGVERCRRRLGD